jgi:hypothetical protein
VHCPNPAEDRSGVKTSKAQHEQKISASTPKPDICVLTSARPRLA